MPSKRLLQQAAGDLAPRDHDAAPGSRTWSGVLPYFLCIYLEPETYEERRLARMHLEQMANVADGAAREKAERQRMVDSVLRGSAIYGLLCEIAGKGALAAHGDIDLIERVQRAIAEHEAALRDATATRREA